MRHSRRHYRHPALDPAIRWTWNGPGEVVYYSRTYHKGARELCATKPPRVRQEKRGPRRKQPTDD